MRSRRGVSVIEIVVVIAVIMIILAFAIPNYQRAWELARKGRCAATLKTMGAAFKMYFTDWRDYPSSLDDLVSVDLLRTSDAFYCSVRRPDTGPRYGYNIANLPSEEPEIWVLSDDPASSPAAGPLPSGEGSRSHMFGKVTLVLYSNGGVKAVED